MRRSDHEYGFVEDNGQVVGFCLGHSFCAEHEFGAKRIKQLLNISVEDHPVGLEGRMSKAPVDADRLVFGEYQDIRTERIGPGKAVKDKEKAAFLICATRWQMDDMRSAMAEGKSKREVIESTSAQFYLGKSSKRYNPERDDIAVSWSGESGFAINVRGEPNIQKLKEIHAAILNGDICMTELTANSFLRKSGALGIYSRIPQEIKESVRVADLERDRILQKVKDSGIEKRLKAAGKGWYALTPDEQSDGSLRFYLNPTEQHINAYGWFTIEDLDDWIRGKGPVATGIMAEKLMKEFGDSIDGLGHGIFKKIDEDGYKLYSNKSLMVDGVPCVRIESNHPELNGIKTLDELKEIFKEKRTMKP